MKLFTVLMLALLFPVLALAHGSGASLETISNGKLIDIGYDPVELVAGERMVFDFELYQEDGVTDVEYDRVWVRVEGNRETFLATGVGKATLGPSTLLWRLPNPAPENITIHARYELKGETLAQGSFEVPVTPVEVDYLPYALSGFAGVLIGIFLSLLVTGARMFFRTPRQMRK